MNYLRPYIRGIKDLWQMGKKYYLLLFIQKLCSASIPFISFIYLTRIVQNISQQQINQVVPLIIQYLSIFGLLQLISSLLGPYVEVEETLVFRAISEAPFKKMLRLQYHYADSSEVSERLYRIDIANMSQQSSLRIQNSRIPQNIDLLIRVVWSLILLTPLWRSSTVEKTATLAWISSPWILLVFLAGVIGIVTLQIVSANKVRKGLGKTDEGTQQVNIQLNYEIPIIQNVESGKEIRLYELENKIIQTQSEVKENARKSLNLIYDAGTIQSILVVVISQLMNYAAYAFIGLRVLLGVLPIGYIIQLSSALSQLLSSLPNLIQYITLAFSNPDALIEYYEFMDLPEEQALGSLPIEKRLDNQYELSVKDVNFAYPDSEKLVLKQVNANFEVGKKYAIVGENGSGKTTFIKLLMRLYEPSSGEILMNRIDAKKYKLTEYFQLFSVVFQDFRLLGMNLGQNIAVNQNYNGKIAMDNLDEVDLGEFVRSLPNQLDTYLGTEFDDGGVQVSGGQAQKIAMARALYKNSPIMILDEPTAALDPVAEFEIYQKFDEMVEDKTAFYISHRLSSCRFCDEILVFDQGEIVQRGSHEELVAVSGKYQELWMAQAQYYQ
jgi:ATP-binding cassette subfamily B protein